MSRFNHSLFSLLKNPPFSSALSKSPINLTTTKTHRLFLPLQNSAKNPTVDISWSAFYDHSKAFLDAQCTHGPEIWIHNSRTNCPRHNSDATQLSVRASPPPSVYNPLLIVAMRVGRGPGRCRGTHHHFVTCLTTPNPTLHTPSWPYLVSRTAAISTSHVKSWPYSKPSPVDNSSPPPGRPLNINVPPIRQSQNSDLPFQSMFSE